MSTVFGYRRMLAILAISLAAILAIGYAVRDWMFLALIRPGESAVLNLDLSEPLVAAHPYWLRRPEAQPPGAWESPWGVDIFWVHPTTVVWPDGAWTSDSSTDLSEPEVERALALFGDGLSGSAPVYAPAYRQAVLQAMLVFDPNSQGALDLAYTDVLAAFDSYVENDNRQRAIILVGVEQGALHASRLLVERFSRGRLRDRLGAAYLLNWATDKDELPIPVCETSNETGCAVGWISTTDTNSARFGKQPSLRAGRYAAFGDGAPMCVNPVSWRQDQTLTPPADHLGGVARFDKQGQPIVLDGTASAKCTSSGLDVEVTTPDLRKSAWWGWGHAFVSADFNLFYADIAANVSERARTISAKLDTDGRKPAKPFPPVRALEEAPIHRSEDNPPPPL